MKNVNISLLLCYIYYLKFISKTTTFIFKTIIFFFFTVIQYQTNFNNTCNWNFSKSQTHWSIRRRHRLSKVSPLRFMPWLYSRKTRKQMLQIIFFSLVHRDELDPWRHAKLNNNNNNNNTQQNKMIEVMFVPIFKIVD